MSLLRKLLEQQNEVIEEIKQNSRQIKTELQEVRIDLNYHIKRTDLLEDSHKKLVEEFKPIKIHVAIMGAFSKALIALGGLCAAAATVWKVFF